MNLVQEALAEFYKRKQLLINYLNTVSVMIVSYSVMECQLFEEALLWRYSSAYYKDVGPVAQELTEAAVHHELPRNYLADLCLFVTTYTRRTAADKLSDALMIQTYANCCMHVSTPLDGHRHSTYF